MFVFNLRIIKETEMELSWREVCSYIVCFFVGLCKLLPDTCVEWTHFITMIIVFITLFFITIPNAWDLHMGRRRKRKNLKRRKDDEI